MTGDWIRLYDDVTVSGWTRRGSLRVRNQGWPLDQAGGHATAYGLRPDRDMVAGVERIGEQRWRLVIPWPANESNLDLIELVPAPARR